MVAPLAPTSSAMPLPMFLLAPVTSATFPASSCAIVRLLLAWLTRPAQLPDCFTVTTVFGFIWWRLGMPGKPGRSAPKESVDYESVD